MRQTVGAVFWIAAWLAITFSHGVSAQSEKMRFDAFPPDELVRRLMGVHGWTIYGSGTIDSDAGTRLAELLEKKRVPLGSHLYLNSPGGNLVGGMNLGRAIRKHGLRRPLLSTSAR